MKDLSGIALARFRNQHLDAQKFTKAVDVVRHLGAVQAQDYEMSKWAVGMRMKKSTADDIEAAINTGAIIRTHALRPTWHLIPAADAHWILELSAPAIRRAMTYNNRMLGLDKKILIKSNTIIEKALRDHSQLTRDELMRHLKEKKLDITDIRPSHYMIEAEISGIVCNGARRGKQHTYALLDERVPSLVRFSKEEALAELAKRFFTSHGPATIKDFSNWSDLSVADSKKGLEMNSKNFKSMVVEGYEYWFSKSGNAPAANSFSILPAFDEYLVGYANRSAAVDDTFRKATMTINGILGPTIIHNGQVVGLWKRTVKPKDVVFEQKWFYKPTNDKLKKLQTAIKVYRKFIGM